MLSDAFLQRIKLNSEKIKILNLSERGITSEDLEKIYKFLSDVDMPNIEELNLYRNNISEDGVTHLTKFLVSHPSIICLNLSYNEIGPVGAQMLAKHINCDTSLKYIDISRNYVRDEGAIFLADALEHNHTIKSMRFFDNSVEMGGKSAFVKMLQKNVGLESFSGVFKDKENFYEKFFTPEYMKGKLKFLKTKKSIA